MEHKLSPWIHLVFSTLNGEALINPDREPMIHDFLKMQLTELGCAALAVNGMPDHIHALFSANSSMRINDISTILKQKSCEWINENSLLAPGFGWQKGFGIFAVDEPDILGLSDYINKQKEVHQTLTFKEEYMSYLKLNLL